MNPPQADCVQHPGEPTSNELRRRLSVVEPLSLRTFTPSLAFIHHSEGCYHYTPEGRKLADFTSGVLVTNLGHNPSRWWRRTCELLSWTGSHGEGPFLSATPLSTYNAATEVELLACERLLDCLRDQPGGGRCEQVMWAASGSEAIQKALWAALAAKPEAEIIVATRHGFHGKKGLAGATTGTEQDHDRDPRVRFISFPREECRNLDARRQPLDLGRYQAELEALRDEFGARLCCLITEPYLGGGGSYHPQPEYLQLLERFCRENEMAFILDEVQSNFGRTGELFAFTTYGVEPDIVCLGKGLGNGIPVSAAVGRGDLFAALDYGEASDTWSANPLSSAAVVATLEEFATGEPMRGLRELAPVLEHGLSRLQELTAVANVRGEGAVWGVECAAVGEMSAEQVASAVVEACYRGDAQGRAIHLLGPLAGRVLRVSPPLVMPAEEAGEYLEVMHDIIAAIGPGA